MAIFVPADWVERRLAGAGILPLDPRPARRYPQGRLKPAVNEFMTQEAR